MLLQFPSPVKLTFYHDRLHDLGVAEALSLNKLINHEIHASLKFK